MGTDNAFAELGLACDATEREVKAAWRRLASQWHPDRNGSADAVARMQRINQAFEAIRNAGFARRPGARPARPTRTRLDDDARQPPPRTPLNRGAGRSIARSSSRSRKRPPAASSRCAAGQSGLRHLRRRRPPGARRQLRSVRRLGRGGEALLLRLARRHERVRSPAMAAASPSAAARTARAPEDGDPRLPAQGPHPARRAPRRPAACRRPARTANPPPADLELRVELLAHPSSNSTTTARCAASCRSTASPGSPTGPSQLPTLAGLRSLALRRER